MSLLNKNNYFNITLIKYVGNTLVGFIISILVFLLAGVTVVNASTPLQISSNNINNLDPISINGDNIVWAGSKDNTAQGNEIYLYKISTGQIYQITNNDYDDSWPITKDGKIVWLGTKAGGDAEVFLYDISSETTTQITNNDNPILNSYKVSGNYVVWSNFNGDSSEINLYDISSGKTTQITNNRNNNESPDIDGEKIVWDGYATFPNTYGYNYIYEYNILTGQTTQISNNGNRDFKPHVNGNKIVWYGGWNNYNIYTYDILAGKTTQISNTSNMEDIDPQINGDNIVWTEYRQGWTAPQLFLYHISNGKTTRITNTNYGNTTFQIDGGKIIWMGDNEFNGTQQTSNIFLYDINTGNTNQLTNSPENVYSPGISGSYAIWYGYTGNSWQIFLQDISNLPKDNQPPIINPLSNTTINQGDTYTATGSFTDPDSTSWTGTVNYGDGTGTLPLTLSGMNFSLSHLFNTAGTFTTTVNITDNQGATGTVTASIIVNPVPTSKDQCKNGGWQNYPNLNFKNQGSCIKYVNH